MDYQFSQIPDIVLKKLDGLEGLDSLKKKKRTPRNPPVRQKKLPRISEIPPEEVSSSGTTEQKEGIEKGVVELVHVDDEDKSDDVVDVDSDVNELVECKFTITKTTSDAIIQTEREEVVEYASKGTQTEADTGYEEYQAYLRAQNLNGFTTPIYQISSKQGGNQPPLKIGLSRPKGAPKRKRKVFYPDEEPYYRPQCPAF